MKDLSKIKVKVGGFKCYGKEPQGFDGIPQITVVIGRNNSGKTTITDVIRYMTEPFNMGRNKEGQVGEVYFSAPLDEEAISRIFKKNYSGGPISGNHYDYGKNWSDCLMTVKLNHDGSNTFLSLEKNNKGDGLIQAYCQPLAGQLKNPFKNLIFKRLKAERDIVGEVKIEEPLSIDENGYGATRIIQSFLTSVGYNRKLIRNDFLREINSIFNPEIDFSEIAVLEKDNKWEIYLEGPNKESIPLSDSGSGLKTVILVLLYTLVVPQIENKKPEDYFYVFEELENNLHPGLQRKLLDYLFKFINQTGCHVFFTTHSAVIVDYFSSVSNAQIVHITNDNSNADIKTVETYLDSKTALEDLDYRASDLLMSNCVVWVEGPSDRIYFNKWIEIFSKGQLKEGNHYQCVSYGGRLLSYLSADADDISEESINILKINKNAILLVDRDRENGELLISKNKQRLINEIDAIGGLSWVTDGREIENYLPQELICDVFLGGNDYPALGKYEDIKSYLNKHIDGLGKKFENNKVIYANKLKDLFDEDNLVNSFDLKDKISEVVSSIAKWNKITLNK